MEFPIQFFLDYAWNPSAIPADKLPEYTRRWAEQQFGAAHASEIAAITTTYLKYAGRRKPELIDTATYSLTNYREAERVVEDYRALLARADGGRQGAGAAVQGRVLRARPASDRSGREPQRSVRDGGEEPDVRARGTRGHERSRGPRTRKLFEHDAEISRYFNTELAGGKWSHMMDQTHIGYTYWQEPPRNTMPRVDVIQNAKPADMGVAVVEQNRVPFAGRGGRGGAGAPPPGFAFGGRGGGRAPDVRQLPAADVPRRRLQSRPDAVRVFRASRGAVGHGDAVARHGDQGTARVGERGLVARTAGRAQGADHVHRSEQRASVVDAVVSNPATPSRESVTRVRRGQRLRVDGSRALHARRDVAGR